jgi:hypothetical protein
VIKRTYDNTVIEERIDDLNYSEYNPFALPAMIQWKTKAIYWGKLDRVDFKGQLILNVPARYAYGDVSVIED